MAIIEHEFICPYCCQSITMVLDLSVSSQIYIEDCEVCCRPIEVHCHAEDGDLKQFFAERSE